MGKLSMLACAALMSVGLATPSLAAMGDAGSGPTTGATPTNDAGSGPTKGSEGMNQSEKNGDSASNARHVQGTTPGPTSTGGSQPTTPGTNGANSNK